MAAVVERLRANTNVFQRMGTVLEESDSGCLLRSGAEHYQAKRAVSCLVPPRVGDEVLFAGSGEGDLYILAVLERAAEGATEVGVPGNLTIKLEGGRLALAAREGVDLVTSRDITLTSKGLEMRASKGRAFIEQLSFLGKKLVGEVEEAKTSIAVLDSVLGRISQRVKRSYRVVEGLDQLRAEEMDYKAEKNLRLRGRNTLLTARKLVKLVGEQIHLG